MYKKNILFATIVSGFAAYLLILSPPMKLILAVTAASGAVYARQTAERLAALDCVESVALVYSDVAPTVMAHEGVALPDHPKFVRYDNRDLFAPPASGSARYDAMIVVPCSVGTAGRIASGVSQTLIERAAAADSGRARDAPVAHPPAQPHGAGRVRRRRAARRTVVLRPPRRHRIALRHGHRTHRRARLPRSRALRMGGGVLGRRRPASVAAIRIDGANPPHERRIPNPPAVRADVSARGRTPLRQGTFGPESCISDFFCNFVRYRSIT